MPLRSGLSLWAYTSPTTPGYPLVVGEYGESVEALDNYPDHAGKLLGQLEVAAEAARRYKGQYRSVASPGAPEVGACGLQMGNQLAGATCSVVVNFKQVLYAAPSSITLSVTSSSNAGSVTYSNLSVYGFTLNVPVVANGAVSWQGTYQTVGN